MDLMWNCVKEGVYLDEVCMVRLRAETFRLTQVTWILTLM